MAAISPFYGTMVFLSILSGIGGSVLMSSAKGEGNEEKGNAYFTAALILIAVLCAAAWVIFGFFHEQIFTFFGADEELMPKVMEYARWLVYAFPVFVLPPFLGAFIRNDGSPNLAMAAVLIGGCANIFGDWFLVFPMGLGMAGAALATVIGTSLQVIIMVGYFFTKRCRLRLTKPYNLFHAIRNILSIGFGASVLDLGTVVLPILMNNQIMRYGGTSALAIYGAIGTIAALFQAMFGGVGQAIQPIVSTNYGAQKIDRIKSVWKMALTTVITMGIVFTAIGELVPKQIVQLFMDTTPEVIAIAPEVIRPYFLLLLFLGITVLSTYYLQSTMHRKMSMCVAILRSVVISSLLLIILPYYLKSLGVWLAMPVSDLIVAIIALYYIKWSSSSGSSIAGM